MRSGGRRAGLLMPGGGARCPLLSPYRILNKEGTLGSKVLCLLLLEPQAEVSGRQKAHGSGARVD